MIFLHSDDRQSVANSPYKAFKSGSLMPSLPANFRRQWTMELVPNCWEVDLTFCVVDVEDGEVYAKELVAEKLKWLQLQIV